MNIVDSSGWLEYFANAENAAFFESAIQDVDHLIVPSINLYEVFKRVYQQRGEDVASQAICSNATRAGYRIDERVGFECCTIELEGTFTNGRQCDFGNGTGFSSCFVDAGCRFQRS